MVFHFLILSGENEDFVREILIDGKSTFLDLHKAIQMSVGYDEGQLASFFVSDDEWEKGQEITMMLMDEESDALLMDEITLHDYLSEPKDRLIYTFDFFGNRGFFVELLDSSQDRELKEPACVREEEEAPAQIMMDFGDDDADMFDLGDEDDEDSFSDHFEEVSLDELGEEW